MNNKEKEQKEKLPFAQRHPILNSLLGLFILLLGIAIAVFVIYWLAQLVGKGVSEFINWGEEKLSKMDSVVVVALITGAVSIIGVLFTAVISKIIEYKQKRREYLNQKRETAYGQFVDVYYKLIEKTQNRVEYTDEDMLDDMSKFSRELTL